MHAMIPPSLLERQVGALERNKYPVFAHVALVADDELVGVQVVFQSSLANDGDVMHRSRDRSIHPADESVLANTKLVLEAMGLVLD